MLFKKRTFYYLLCFVFFNFLFNVSAFSSPIPFIKNGTVIFAKLDTTIDSSQPDMPIQATINDGKYKNAKLQGKLTTIKDSQGNAKTILYFSLIQLNKKKILRPISISAYAINYDSARAVLVTGTANDELQHDVIPLATAFLADYTNAAKIHLGSGNDLGILFMSNVV